MMGLLRRVPVAVGSLALGLAGVGNLIASRSAGARVACGLLAAAALALLAAAAVADWRRVRADLSTSAALSVLPASFMAVMILATYVAPAAPAAAKALWVLALAAQLAVSVVFLSRHFVRLSVAEVLPSWFLVFVGYVVAALTSPAFSMQTLGRGLVVVGAAGYLVSLALVAYRLRRLGLPPEPARPTIAIFAAPPSLLLAGYLAAFPAKQPAVAWALMAVSALSVTAVLAYLPRVVGRRFYPAYAALTFPFVITAVAFKQAGAFVATASGPLPVLAGATTALEVIAVFMVAFVTARYVAFLATPARAPQAAAVPERAAS